jgi:hypothetical protein
MWAVSRKRNNLQQVTWSLHQLGRNQMPVILWLLGVPLFVVILLMLFHVI